MTVQNPAAGSAVGRAGARAPSHVRRLTETKAFYKTSEFIIYVLAVIAVLIASAVVDKGADGQGFGAQAAWTLVTWLTVGYVVSRGLAKAGSPKRDDD
jgi:hypothetical protein